MQGKLCSRSTWHALEYLSRISQNFNEILRGKITNREKTEKENKLSVSILAQDAKRGCESLRDQRWFYGEKCLNLHHDLRPWGVFTGVGQSGKPANTNFTNLPARSAQVLSTFCHLRSLAFNSLLIALLLLSTLCHPKVMSFQSLSFVYFHSLPPVFHLF